MLPLSLPYMIWETVIWIKYGIINRSDWTSSQVIKKKPQVCVRPCVRWGITFVLKKTACCRCISIGSMPSKTQKLNNDRYKVMEKPSAVGRAQTGNHKNWILIWVLLLIRSVNLDTLSSFFLVCQPVLKMDSHGKETRAISKTFTSVSLRLSIYYL